MTLRVVYVSQIGFVRVYISELRLEASKRYLRAFSYVSARKRASGCERANVISAWFDTCLTQFVTMKNLSHFGCGSGPSMGMAGLGGGQC